MSFRLIALVTALVLSAAHDWTAAQSIEEDDADSVRAEQAPAKSAQRPDLQQVASMIVDRTNAFRQEQDHSPVPVQKQLAATAQYFADYMASTDRYGHTADGNRPAQRVKDHGYAYCIVTENIAYQYSSEGFATEQLAQRFVEGWKESPGHRKNMLDESVTQTGVAVAHSEKSGAYYAVQMFGRPSSMRLEFSVTNKSGKPLQYTVAEQKFDLPPHFSRTHQRCRPALIRLELPGQEQASSYKPAGGTEFILWDSPSGGVTVEQRSGQKAKPEASQ